MGLEVVVPIFNINDGGIAAAELGTLEFQNGGRRSGGTTEPSCGVQMLLMPILYKRKQQQKSRKKRFHYAKYYSYI